MTNTSTPTGAYAALKIPEFRSFIFARVCITLALQIQGTIVGWQVYEITGDPFSLGLIGLAEALPAIGVALYAGHIADIVERKKIIIFTIGALLICSAALLLFTQNPETIVNHYGALPIYAVIFVSGLARGFLTPANFALMPQLIPRALYTNAISLNSTFWEAAAIGGPMLASGIYLASAKYLGNGLTGAYTADVLLTVAALGFYFSIPSKPLPPASEEEQGVWDKIGEGLKFVFSNQIVLSAISLDLFAVLFGGAVAMLPVFAKDILHSGAETLGIMRSAPGIGALLMAVYITHNPIKRNIGKKLLWCVAGFGFCMIGFGLSTNVILSIFFLALSGAFDSVSVIVRGTLIHTLTPENMKGRVSAVNSMFIGSSNEIGAFESGLAAKLLGVVTSVVFGGCMTLGVVGVTTWKAKKLVKLQNVS